MPCEIRILDYNYVNKDNVSVTASSEQISFPVSNVQTEFRSKAWRSDGYFLITATNNKINFKETSLGPEITATIPVGSYTSNDLANEIKSQMESVTLNARIYTVTQSNTTGKWIISTTTFLSLLWSTGTNVATSIGPSLGYAVADQTGLLSYQSAAMSLHTEEWVLIDLQTAEDIDSFAMVFDPLRGIPFTSGAILKLQANATANFTTPAVDITLVVNDTYEVITHFFATSQNYRYWRVKIVDPLNPNLYVEIGALVLAKATLLSQNPEIGFSYTIQDQSDKNENDYGNGYADLYPKRARLKFNYKWITDADTLLLEEIYRRLGTTEVLSLCLDVTEELFDKERFFIYGKFVGNFDEKNSFYNFFDTDLEILEAF